jgi:26S proteasome regulatory subunit N6
VQQCETGLHVARLGSDRPCCRAGILEQGTGCLEVFDELPEGKAYPAAIDVVHNMGPVVDALFTRSQKLVA